MDYTLHQLRIFLAVVKHKNMTRAAEEMHITQPALSIQMKNFQSQFDISLTEISGKKLRITEFGYDIAVLAENVLHEADTIHHKMTEYNGLLTGKLRIATASTGKYIIPYFLSRFLSEHPGVNLTLDVCNKATAVKGLQDNDIDFALVSVLPFNVGVHEEILLENKLYVVNHKSELGPNQPIIFREEGSSTRNTTEHYFNGNEHLKNITLNSNEAVKQAIIAGLGYSLLPLIGIQDELMQKKLHIIPNEDMPIVTNWRLIWLKKKRMSPASIAYLEFIRDKKVEIAHKHFSWYLNFDPIDERKNRKLIS